MKARLKRKSQVPYGGGFVVKDKMGGYEIRGSTFELLHKRAVAARRANGLPVGAEFEDELESWVCEVYPQACQDVDPAAPRRRKLTMQDVVNGSKVMGKLVASGRRLVTQAEAQRRADICLRCPMNASFARPCSGLCGELKELVLALVGNVHVKGEERLYSCNVCACFLQAAVWLPLETQCVGVDEGMKKAFAYMREQSGCWKECGGAPGPGEEERLP